MRHRATDIRLIRGAKLVDASSMPAHAEPAADKALLTCREVLNMVDVSVPTAIIVQIVRGSHVEPRATACLQRAHAQQTVVPRTPSPPRSSPGIGYG